jgi:hypothetical protein
MKAKLIRLAATSAVALCLNLSAWSMGSPKPSEPRPPSENTRWSHLDPKNVVPSGPLNQALHYFEKHESKIKNKNYLTIIDFTQHSSKKRLYLINLNTGSVEQHLVAHGSGSQRTNTGWIPGVSNTNGSHMSSEGFYLTAETYSGQHGFSMRLDGLSPTNSNARRRAIVVHPASYVKEGMNPIGRSWGCPALDPRVSAAIINKIKNGSLMYGYNG